MLDRRWAALSLRLRVTLVAVLAVAVGLAAAAMLLVLSLQAGLVGGLDDAARARAGTAAAAVDRGDLRAAVSTVGVDSLVQVLGPGGTVVASSPGLGVDRPLVALPVAAGAQQQPDISIAERDARMLTQTAAGGRVVVVVSPLTDVQESGAQLARRLLAGGPVRAEHHVTLHRGRTQPVESRPVQGPTFLRVTTVDPGSGVQQHRRPQSCQRPPRPTFAVLA